MAMCGAGGRVSRFDRVEDLRANCWQQNSQNRLLAVVRGPIAVTIRALADEPFTAQRQTHFAAQATAWRTPVRVRPGLGSEANSLGTAVLRRVGWMGSSVVRTAMSRSTRG